MAFSLIASAKETSGADGPTDAINTTGANLIVVVVAAGSGTTGTLTDSKSNTWTELTEIAGSGMRLRIFYCYAPSVGSGHTWSCTAAVSGICVAAFSGAAASPFDLENGTANGAATSGQPGSITPSENNCLVVTGIIHGAAEAFSSINGGFTLEQNKAGVSAVVYSCGLAYLIQTTAAAANPTWSWPTSAASNVVIASFKAAAGGANATPLLMQMYSGS